MQMLLLKKKTKKKQESVWKSSLWLLNLFCTHWVQFTWWISSSFSEMTLLVGMKSYRPVAPTTLPGSVERGSSPRSVGSPALMSAFISSMACWVALNVGSVSTSFFSNAPSGSSFSLAFLVMSSAPFVMRSTMTSWVWQKLFSKAEYFCCDRSATRMDGHSFPYTGL